MSKIDEVLNRLLDDEIAIDANQYNQYNIMYVVNDNLQITLPPIILQNYFVGRENDVSEIKNRLNHNNMLIINGVGGIGKTSILKYVYKNVKDVFGVKYKHIAWIDYDINIEYSFIKAFKYLEIPFGLNFSPKEKFQKIIFELNKLGNNLLLLIDNVDKAKDEDGSLNDLYKLNSHIILSGRVNIFKNNKYYQIGLLSDCSCKRIFLENYKYKYPSKDIEVEQYIEKIIKLCGNHSLLIDILSKTSNNDELTIMEVFDKLKESNFNLDEFNSKVASDWDDERYEITIKEHIVKVFKICGVDLCSREALFKLSLLAPSNINKNKACSLLDINGDSINRLLSKGWIQSDNDNIKMHRVVKEAIVLQRKFSVDKYEKQLLEMNNMIVWKEKFSELDELIVHAEEFLVQFRKSQISINHEFAGRIADYYKFQGDFKRCIYFIEKKIELLHNNNDMKQMAKNKIILGAMKLEIGDYQGGLNELIESLKIRKKFYNHVSPECAECYAHIGFAYQEMGIYKKSLTNYKKSLLIRISIFGKSDAVTARSYNNIALLNGLMYQKNKALNFIDEAIVIRKKYLLITSERKDVAELDHAQSQNIKGFIYLTVNECDKAYQFLEKSMHTRLKYLGENNAMTATAFQRMSLCLTLLRKNKEAKQYIDRAIAIYVQNGMQKTLDIAFAYNTYGIIKRFENDKDSVELHMVAIKIVHGYSKTHPRLLFFYEELANTYHYFSDNVLALKYYHKALLISKSFLEETSAKVQQLNKKIDSIKIDAT